ncbi:MAG: hypothetical protein ACOCWJ_01270 [Verrucomicrobiota bacterium]
MSDTEIADGLHGEGLCFLAPAAWLRKRVHALRRAQAGDVDWRLRELCAVNRIHALTAIRAADHGWLGASFSAAEILTSLYFDPEMPSAWLSGALPVVALGKGHAAAMQYACLAACGAIPPAALLRYKCPDGPQAHADIDTPGVPLNTGSLGQALSKSYGLAVGGKEPVFCLLGDGELQEGQCWEAFQTLAHRNCRDVIPVIDRNGIQSDTNVADIKEIPNLGRALEGLGLVVREIDGHDFAEIRRAVCELRASERAGAILARTKKGGGVPFMAADSCEPRSYAWHGGVPNSEQTAEVLRELAKDIDDQGLREALLDRIRELRTHAGHDPASAAKAATISAVSTGEAFGDALCRQADKVPDLVVLDADLEKPCRLRGFAERFPERFLEMGISEQDMVSTAGGLALGGRLPVVNTYAAFFRRAFEQVYVNATESTRVLYVGHYAGLCYTTDGKTHQCTGDVAMMRSIPRMQVLYPAFPEEVPQMLNWCTSESNPGSCYIRLHRTPVETVVPDEESHFFPGSPVGVRRNGGASAAVLTAGPRLVSTCAAIADELSEQGAAIDVFAVSDHSRMSGEFVRRILAEYETVVVIEELAPVGGLFDLTSDSLTRHCEEAGTPMPRLLRRAADGFTFSTRDPDGLYRHFGLDARSLTTLLSAVLLIDVF